MRLGLPLWHRETGERFTYCGPALPGMYYVKNRKGLRQVKAGNLSRRPSPEAPVDLDSPRTVVKLRWEIDPNEPELEAEVLSTNGRTIRRVRIIGNHGVWKGTVFNEKSFTVVSVA